MVQPLNLAKALSSPTLSRRPFLRLLRHWLERHRHPLNFFLHLLGIPVAVAGVGLLFFLHWYWGAGALVLGYALQFVGHAVEGNDVGEWAGLKRLLGLPYVAISPRWQNRDPSQA
jgi:hypothetical protein